MGREYRPAEQEVLGAGGVLVNQELHLHVDPALVAAKAGDERNRVEPRSVRLHQDIPLNRW
jgi:hypothetical protein